MALQSKMEINVSSLRCFADSSMTVMHVRKILFGQSVKDYVVRLYRRKTVMSEGFCILNGCYYRLLTYFPA